MQTTSGVDIEHLKNQVQRLGKSSKKLLPDICNQRLLNAAGRAFNATPIADKAKIIRDLGVIGYESRVNKAGKIVKGKRFFAQSFRMGVSRAALIVNARRATRGEKGLTGNKMEKAIVKMLAGRKRSVGFEKSAYIPGMKVLASKLKKPFKIARTKGIAIYGRPKGEATPARDGINVSATIVNNAKEIYKVGLSALQQGINEESSEIQRKFGGDIKPLVDEFNRGSR